MQKKMDKYEFNIKVEQIKKMVSKGDYETAMKIADTIDWRRVRNVNILSMVATIYEKNEEFQEAKDILLLAFERAPIGKRLLYKLAELAIRQGSVEEAEDYYREFCDLAPDDPRQHILRYLILGAKGAPVQQLIHTLEQYCNEELDEKWLYELAELYNEAGMGELCVMTCDKIMLMFGLGKYVEKAMELKIQYAPLTTQQMDLVENRDKYEARLKAVEKEYEVRRPAYLADREAAYTREPEAAERVPGDEGYDAAADGYGASGVGYDGAAAGYGGAEAGSGYDASEDGYGGAGDGYDAVEAGYGASGAGYGEREAGYDASEDAEDGETGFSGEADGLDGNRGAQADEDAAHGEVMIEPEEDAQQWIPGVTPGSDEEVQARFHEEEARARLAREMSKLSDEEMAGPAPEPAEMHTKVLSDIRTLSKLPRRSSASHLMIGASAPEDGLKQAVEALRRIHQETGAKNQAAKITGEKLNRRGIFTISDKLTGKDLIIEQAGDMSEAILQELNQLMTRDETGMNVVLIDTPERLERLKKNYPGLAKWFEEAAGGDDSSAADAQSASPARKGVRVVPAAAGGIRTVPAASRTEAQPAGAARGGSGNTSAAARTGAQPVRTGAQGTSAAATRGGAQSVSPARGTAGAEASPVRGGVQPVAAASRGGARPAAVGSAAATAGVRPTEGAAGQAGDNRPVRRVQPKRDNAMPPIATLKKQPVLNARAQEEQAEESRDAEMGIDEFAQYAQKYASDIDCSISGKSMLALYERIEIMQEDGIALTRANAEDLIEEAADKAENPALVKKLTGIFSSRYDKEGMLILKEEHFI